MSITVLQQQCGCYRPDGTQCNGQVLVTGEDDHLIDGQCNTCGAAFALPVRQAHPQLKQTHLLTQAGLPDRFNGRKFNETPENAQALAAVRSWLADYDQDPLPAPVFWGQPGRGKSHLLVAVCRRLVMEKQQPVAYFTARELLRDLQRFSDDTARERTWRRATTVRVLALDDLGAQQQTDWRHDQLAELVDERYERELPILAATNFPPPAWGQMLDARSVSRLQGMTFPVELTGPDRRTEQF